MIDKYVYVIVALLPLTSAILLFETNPYNSLILRGILGAVAALVYAVLGAADVALTEALVGTMLAVTLYVIAVRSSLVMRLGIVKEPLNMGKVADHNLVTQKDNYLKELVADLRKVIKKYHLRLELVEYSSSQALEQALRTKEVHAICTESKQLKSDKKVYYQTSIRVHRLFEILETELTSKETELNYLNLSNLEEKH